MRISDWSSDVCSSDLDPRPPGLVALRDRTARGYRGLRSAAQCSRLAARALNGAPSVAGFGAMTSNWPPIAMTRESRPWAHLDMVHNPPRATAMRPGPTTRALSRCLFRPQSRLPAPVAQLDRAPDF